jgi:hypothetical protein
MLRTDQDDAGLICADRRTQRSLATGHKPSGIKWLIGAGLIMKHDGATQSQAQGHEWSTAIRQLVSWRLVAWGLALAAGLLVANRGRFASGQELAAYPARMLALGMVLAGALYLCLLPLIRADVGLRGRALLRRLGMVVLVGFGLRVMMLWSTPALEDDYNRYLWDGGVTANGHNPYRYPPAEGGETGTGPETLKSLATDAEAIHGRINHPNLRTRSRRRHLRWPISPSLGAFSLGGWCV